MSMEARWSRDTHVPCFKMPKRLAETQLTQDNADQYLDEKGDEDEVREFATVFVGYVLHRVLSSVYLTDWTLHESKSRGH